MLPHLYEMFFLAEIKFREHLLSDLPLSCNFENVTSFFANFHSRTACNLVDGLLSPWSVLKAFWQLCDICPAVLCTERALIDARRGCAISTFVSTFDGNCPGTTPCRNVCAINLGFYGLPNMTDEWPKLRPDMSKKRTLWVKDSSITRRQQRRMISQNEENKR